MRRDLKAIIKKTFRSGSTMKTVVPKTTFIVALLFVVTMTTVFIAIFFGWIPRLWMIPKLPAVTLVNTPETFREYMETTPPETFVVTDYQETDALYDFVSFGQWMNKADTVVTIVFPKDFDEIVTTGDTETLPSILTYIRSDSLENKSVDEDIKDNYLDSYHQYLRNLYCTNGTDDQDTVRIVEYPVSTITASQEEQGIRWLATSAIPLILFIIVLYCSMSVGTNVIAGEKEQGTFAAVILSPIPRKDIVIGSTIGVALRTLIPTMAAAFLILTEFEYRNSGFFLVLLLLMSLILLIASITILISVLNESVISAQTAFLPVFLILIMVCVTCIQDTSDVARSYYWFPIYGHFYGIGSACLGEQSLIDTLICIITSLLLTGICYLISQKALTMEMFTTYAASSSDEKVKTGPEKPLDIGSFLFNHAIRPLWYLAIFQFLAMFPVVVNYMRKAEYTNFIIGLKDVTGTADIIKKGFGIMEIFMRDPLFIFLLGIGYFLTIGCYLFRVILYEKDTLASAGLPYTSPVIKYIKGAVMGFVMISSVYLILLLTGKIGISGNGINRSNIMLFFAFVFMWFPQGAAEELLFRGYLIPRVEKRTGKIFAVIFSSLLFSVFHSLNPGFSVLALINLTLIAVFFALVYEYTGNIWMTCAAHSVWNFCQGNLYGLEVSGNRASASVIVSEYGEGISAIWTGGDFGPEGSIAVTIVTLVMIALISVLMKRKISKGKIQSAR